MAIITPYTKASPGRPSLYRRPYCQLVLESGLQGASRTQIAVTIGVNRETLNNWARKHPEFLAAIKRADEAALAWWEDLLQKQATGEARGNVTATIFSMKNRFKHEYGDQTNHTQNKQAPSSSKPLSGGEFAKKLAFLLELTKRKNEPEAPILEHKGEVDD